MSRSGSISLLPESEEQQPGGGAADISANTSVTVSFSTQELVPHGRTVAGLGTQSLNVTFSQPQVWGYSGMRRGRKDMPNPKESAAQIMVLSNMPVPGVSHVVMTPSFGPPTLGNEGGSLILCLPGEGGP